MDSRRGLGAGRPERGFTLPEMLVVLAIIGIFLLVALPAAANYIKTTRVRSAADSFSKDIQACRYIAVTTRQNRTLALGSGVPASFYTYTDVRGSTKTITLPDGVTIDTATNFPVTFNTLGGLAGSAAAATVTGRITPSRSHIFTITVGTTGKVSSSFNGSAP